MTAITVLMAAYNAELYIRESIESVLNQSYADFEFIIINDGSSDNTENIICSFSDRRIRYFSQVNAGLAKSLNKGLHLAKGKYIARIDADDVCYKHRLSEQLHFMESNPGYVICGSYADVTDENGGFIYTYKNIPTTDAEIKRKIVYENCFVHSATFYRLDMALLAGCYYEPIKQHFEDYMFFFQILKHGKGYNIQEPLIKYRLTPGSISSRARSKKYNKLVVNVVNRGYITDNEMSYLDRHKTKLAKQKVKVSNHYLTLSRLVLAHQRDYRKSLEYYSKALRANFFCVNNFLTVLYLIAKTVIK